MRTESPKKVKRTERSSRDNRRCAAVPGRKDAAHGARRRGRNNLLHRRAQADRRYHGRRRRLLGQELADGTLVAVGRMRGGNARPGLILTVAVVMVVKQRGRQ